MDELLAAGQAAKPEVVDRFLSMLQVRDAIPRAIPLIRMWI